MKSFKDNKLELISLEITSKIKKQIEDLLFNFSNEKFEVVVTKKQQQRTLKSQLMGKIESSQDFSLIKKHFPNSSISDIFLKN